MGRVCSPKDTQCGRSRARSITSCSTSRISRRSTQFNRARRLGRDTDAEAVVLRAQEPHCGAHRTGLDRHDFGVAIHARQRAGVRSSPVATEVRAVTTICCSGKNSAATTPPRSLPVEQPRDLRHARPCLSLAAVASYLSIRRQLRVRQHGVAVRRPSLSNLPVTDGISIVHFTNH